MKETLQEIRKLVRAGQAEARRAGGSPSMSVLMHSIRHDIELSARALEHYDRAVSRHYVLVRALFKEEEKRLLIEDERHRVGLDVELSSRQIYELLYAIKVLVDKAGRPASMSKEAWEELDRLCIYRGCLVTHKETAERRAPV